MVVATFNQEKALVGAFSVITNLRMDLFETQVGNWANHTRQLQAGAEQLCRQTNY